MPRHHQRYLPDLGRLRAIRDLARVGALKMEMSLEIEKMEEATLERLEEWKMLQEMQNHRHREH
jgi:hypothetical protein